jgi:hypothetical protein
MASAGLPHEMKMYPPYMPSRPTNGVAPGHAVFEADGIPIWGRDAIAFLDRYLKA